MFWAEEDPLGNLAFRPVSVNASVIRYFIEDAECGPVEDARVEQICMGIEQEINIKLNLMRPVPDIVQLFMNHYVGPNGENCQRKQVDTLVSDR